MFGFVSLAVRLDDYPDLVSSNPLRYLYACWTLNFHLFLAWSQVIDVDVGAVEGRHALEALRHDRLVRGDGSR